MKKQKEEILLTDVFRAIKASQVIHSIGKKAYTTTYRERMLENFDRIMETVRKRPFSDANYELKEFFFYTKPLTGFTKRDAYKMYFNYVAIRKLRNDRQANKPKIVMTTLDNTRKKNRIYPLPEYKYHELAKRIWEKYGCPKWGKSKFNGIFFGNPITNWDYRRNILVKRTIGVEVLVKENNQCALGCHILDEQTIYFGKNKTEQGLGVR